MGLRNAASGRGNRPRKLRALGPGDPIALTPGVQVSPSTTAGFYLGSVAHTSHHAGKLWQEDSEFEPSLGNVAT